MDSDGSLVWSTQTTGRSVSGLNLTEEGNLVLYGEKNETIWQSFDHPTDTLLPGQLMCRELTLKASISKSNFGEVLYSFYLGNGSSAYAYAQHLNSYQYVYEYQDLNEITGRTLYSTNWSNNQFVKFEPDGSLRMYGWLPSDSAITSWGEIAVFLTSWEGFCDYPAACGIYGICENVQYCACPELKIFMQNSRSQASPGCSLITPIACEHSRHHSLLEMEKMTYIGRTLKDEFGKDVDPERVDLETCKRACLMNCSCKAVHFEHLEGLSIGKCLLLNEALSLVIRERVNRTDTSVYLKVQNSSVLHNRPWILQRNAKMMLGTIGASIGVVLTIGVCFAIFRKKPVLLKEEEELLNSLLGMPTRFSYQDLIAITENFNRKLGEGGFGSVFEGILSEGIKIAVKRLKSLDQAKNSFLAEVTTIGSIHHVNLVKLIGFCAEQSQRLLVFEHMANGSLDRWIFNGKQEYVLTWHTKKRIRSDIAKGLAYLHEDCNHKIIHLDIKPQNILLDENFNAKVADFGLSKLVAKNQSKVVTKMKGTPGYIAPEWMSLAITEKVDVYSFGIVILEIICGRKNVDWDLAEEEIHLLSLFKRKIEEDQLSDMFDMYNEDLESHKEEAVGMMRMAAWCLQSDFTKRPSMSVAVKALHGLAAVETNLDFHFFYPPIPRNTIAMPNQEGEETASIPSVLSGPR